MNKVWIFLGLGVIIIISAWLLLRPQAVTTPPEPGIDPATEPADEQPTDPAPDTATTTPVDDGTATGNGDAVAAFPPTVTENVIADIVEGTEYTAADITIESVTDQTWPNGCLGLAEPDEMCTEALVPGYEVRAEANGDSFIYRTDSTGSQVRREE